MTDYTIFYKTPLPAAEPWCGLVEWDVFISAYNSSERVNTVFRKAPALRKHWVIIPDYRYTKSEYPDGDVFAPEADHEADLVLGYAGRAGLELKSQRLCVDITGFTRPCLIFLLRWLHREGIGKFDALYSEPDYYEKKEETRFSDEQVVDVRQIQGFEGNHSSNVSNDLLVVGVGYDHELIAHVAESKGSARKVEVFGLPSLRPDMYQESVLRAHRAAESVGGGTPLGTKYYYAPANDPFVTASVLHQIAEDEKVRAPLTNLYLCSLGPKPQTLGFAIYYLSECQGSAASMLYPICRTYSRETSKGLSRVWRYTVEFP
jgi:hypothetical protein